jgi:hypothetical protein
MKETGVKKEPIGFQERLRMFDEFRMAKNKILSPEDFIEVSSKDRRTGEIRKRKMILKSGWRKIKLFFGISSEILEIRREKDGNKIIYLCKSRVYTQSGMSAEAVGVCSSDEPGKSNMPEYILSSIAQTRAINKAIADLVGADFDEDIDVEKLSDEDIDISHIERSQENHNYGETSEKALPSEKSKIISFIFDMVRKLESEKKINKGEIFNKIKEYIGFPKNQQIRITDLDIETLKKIDSFLRAEIENLQQKTNYEEENFF